MRINTWVANVFVTMGTENVEPVTVTVVSDTGRLRKEHREYMGEKHHEAIESNRPFVLTRIPSKYGKVTCRVDTMDRRFYASAIDEFEKVYQEYKQKMEDDPEYKSHPVFNGGSGHGWVHVTQVMQPYADELTVEFAEIAADLSNTTTRSLGIGKSRF